MLSLIHKLIIPTMSFSKYFILDKKIGNKLRQTTDSIFVKLNSFSRISERHDTTDKIN